MPASDLAVTITRAFGWRGLARRFTHVAAVRTGLAERQTPVHDILPDPVFDLPYAVDVSRIREAYRLLPGRAHVDADVVARADRLLTRGQLQFFSGDWLDVGWPPDWLRHPLTGTRYDSAVHWSRIADLDPTAGDIKYVWEPSRFGFVFLLARAWLVSDGDPRFAEAFWAALESWVATNPANGGPNWSCGQETSLRAMSVLFGLLVFSDTATESRAALAGGLLRASGRRVLPTLRYALSQRNNHAVSELVCLATLSELVPAWSETRAWSQAADRGLAEVIDDQFYEDGSYSQQSFNYHRLAMHNLIWLLFIDELVGRPSRPAAVEALRRSTTFLYQMQDDATGWLPHYGADDGALILPLAGTEYRDFRPVLQTASLLTTGARQYAPGAWDEEAAWLAPAKLASAPTAGPRLRTDVSTSPGGYHTMRGPESYAFVRGATSFRHRPSQDDNLHADIWIAGTNVACDPGTYSYNAPTPDGMLARGALHNTAGADGGDHMTPITRFLSGEWPRAERLCRVAAGRRSLLVWESALMPPSRGRGTWRRAVYREDDGYAVVDRLTTDRRRRLSVHWNVPTDGRITVAADSCRVQGPSWAVELTCDVAVRFADVMGDTASGLGWHAPTYGQRAPIRSVTATHHGAAATFVTTITHADSTLDELEMRRVVNLLRLPLEQLQHESRMMTEAVNS